MIIITIIAFLFIIAFSVTIHELGHLLLAKLFKIPVEKFSIGFGPPLVRKKIGETDFRIAYFPVGGYVKMTGEDEGEIQIFKKKQEVEFERSIVDGETVPGFYDVPIYHRILVVLSGPIFNILSAVIVLFFVYVVFGVYVNPHLRIKVEEKNFAKEYGFLNGDSLIAINDKKLNSWDDFLKFIDLNLNKKIEITLKREDRVIKKELFVESESLGISPLIPPVIGSVKIGGPADRAGLKTGDRILKVAQNEIDDWDEFVNLVRSSKNVPLNFVWESGGEVKEAEITPLPYYDPILKDTIGQIGVMIQMAKNRIYPHQAFVMAINRTIEIIGLTLKTLYQLILGKVSRKALGGPIAIAQLSGESARWGFENFLGLVSIISINLGLVNLFPIPGLDGGHIVIAIIEGIRKKRFTRKTRMVIQQIGYTILLLLIIYVTFNDLTR
uniref:Zinc metalloprotease n=1 Tax=candidate division WOR-3 bacterium TaxID=2052148 RepID=A0A7C4TAQ9_UNCW3